MPGTDTAERSLAHWSEAGRAEMEAFYALARLDYDLLATALDWRALLPARAGANGRIRLLDVACGSGKFPAALLAHARLPADPAIDVDLLDPSRFSIDEARSVLAPPFHAAAEHECTLQALDPAAGPFDVVWAIHALYALPADELADAMRAFLGVLRPGGLGVIAHATEDAHYLRVYRAFLADFRGGDGTPYTSSAQIRDALARAGATEVRTTRLDYHGEVASADTATLEGYLQRCAFDATVSLRAMERAPTLGPYLATCRDEVAGLHRFEQHVDLMLVDATP